MEAKSKPISAPGCGFPPEGLYLLGWYGLCQSQQPVEEGIVSKPVQKLVGKLTLFQGISQVLSHRKTT